MVKPSLDCCGAAGVGCVTDEPTSDSTAPARPIPVVLMHGILGSAPELEKTQQLLEECMPGVYVLRLEIGNGKVDSMRLNMQKQVEMFAETIAADENLAGGFNLVGFSQGGLLGRGYIQFHMGKGGKYPLVHNFISWVSPQAGQFGVPKVTHSGTPKAIRKFIHAILPSMYGRSLQDNVSWSNYWRDPKHLGKGTYHEKSSYLADLNNEKEVKNPDYKAQLLKLDHYVLVKSSKDNILSPRETGWFEFWDETEHDEVCPLEQTKQYQEDWLGLRELDESGRLHRFVSHCPHEDYYSQMYLDTFRSKVLPFLVLPAHGVLPGSRRLSHCQTLGVRVAGGLDGGWTMVDTDDADAC